MSNKVAHEHKDPREDDHAGRWTSNDSYVQEAEPQQRLSVATSRRRHHRDDPFSPQPRWDQPWHDSCNSETCDSHRYQNSPEPRQQSKHERLERGDLHHDGKGEKQERLPRLGNWSEPKQKQQLSSFKRASEPDQVTFANEPQHECTQAQN